MGETETSEGKILADAVTDGDGTPRTGGTPIEAAIQLGIPRLAADNALRVIHRALAGTSRHDAFDQAIGNVTEHLHAAIGLIDYGRRRDALRAWEISPQQWRELIEDYPGR